VERRPTDGWKGGLLTCGARRCDDSQLQAIRSIKHNVAAIQGPPGTGKTTTIAALVAHGIPQLTTLITCVQNKAIDPIAAKLREQVYMCSLLEFIRCVLV